LAEMPNAEATDSLARIIAGIPQGLWNLGDATLIAGRLIGMLPGRSPKVTAAPAASKANWLPPAKTIMILASTAFAVAYVISLMMRS
jgi:hypothetical protein